MSIATIKKVYSTNKVLEQEGVWYSPPLIDDPNIKFLLARMGNSNKVWQGEQTRLYREHQRELNQGIFSEKLQKKILSAFCRIILLNWHGILNDDNWLELPNYDADKPIIIPYTPHVGFKLLSNAADLYDELADEANIRTRYQNEVNDDIAKK